MAAGTSSVLFPPAPVEGESLIGLVARTAHHNYHRTVAPILAAAGYPHHAHFDIAVARQECLPGLAKVLSVDQTEVAVRAHRPDPVVGAVRLDFFGATVMACDLDFRLRRVSPLSLREAGHHRALWSHRLVPWCLETGGMLIDVCPSCGARLGWHRAEGIAACDKCAADLRDYDAERDRRHDWDEMHEAIAPLLDLLSPHRERHTRALARLHPDIQAVGRGAAFELGWKLAAAFGAPAGETQRQRHGKLPVGAIVATLATSAELLVGWPDCIENGLGAIGGSNDAQILDRVVRRLRGDFRPRRFWPELSALVTEASPAIFGKPVRSRGVVHAFAPHLVGGREATRTLGITSKKFTRLHKSGMVDQLTRGGGDRHAFATYDAQDLARSGEAFRDRLRAATAANRIGVTAHGLEQLLCLGALVEIHDPRVIAVSPGRQISLGSFDAFVTRIERAASSDAALEWRADHALKAIGGREKPFGPLMMAMCGGRLPFALVCGEGSLLDRVRFRRGDALHIAALRFDEADHPTVTFSKTMTRIDAVGVLNIAPTAMMAALQGELAGARTTNKLLRRDAVLQLAQIRISAGEIRHRWMAGHRGLPPGLRPGGQIRRSGATGWSRAAVEFHMEGSA